jgi:probable HAF family extracellular repeat protein
MVALAPQGFGVDTSSDGSIAVGTIPVPAPYWEAQRWTASGEAEGLGLPAGYAETDAHGIAGDGSVIVGTGWTSAGFIAHAFTWTEDGGLVWLGEMPDFSSSNATDISFDGSVIVGAGTGATGRLEAFRWTAESGMVGLGAPPSGTSWAAGVSDDGSTIVGYRQPGSNQIAYRWTAATSWSRLGDLSGESIGSVARASSADGSVIVGGASGLTKAFIWTEDAGIRSLQDVLTSEYGLDLQGLTLVDATAISGDGRNIVGYGLKGNDSRSYAWLAILPEPQSGALLGMATCVLLVWRRHAILDRLLHRSPLL